MTETDAIAQEAAPAEVTEAVVTDPQGQPETTTDETATPETETVGDEVQYLTIGGEQVAMDEIERGYLRQQDYTRKTQELAQKAKEADRAVADKALIDQGFNALRDKLDALSAEETPDFLAMAKKNPAQAFQAQLEWNARQGQVKEATAIYESIISEQSRAHDARELGLLIEKVPEWAGDGYLKAGPKLAETLKAYGYQSETELPRDHRFMLMARDAMAYQAGKSAVPAVEKRVAEAPKTLKPAAQQPAALARANEVRSLAAKAKESGSLEDLAALLAARRRP